MKCECGSKMKKKGVLGNIHLKYIEYECEKCNKRKIKRIVY